MSMLRPLALATAMAAPAVLMAAPPAFAQTAQTAAAPRPIPAKELPVPDTASPGLQALIAAPLFPAWNVVPKSPEDWKALSSRAAENARKAVAGLIDKFGVTVTPGEMGGVKVYTVTPKEIAPENQNRVLLYFHGGAFVLNPDIAGTREAIPMAAYSRIKVVAVDYRMPPDHPFPAAYDDASAVFAELTKTVPAKNVAVFGSSAGGGLALSLATRLKQEGKPLPGALGLGSPWTEMSGRGDSMKVNEFVDNFLVSNDGFLDASAKLYANGVDLKDPRLSALYGDLAGMPPTVLTTGTRDLFLSNTVRTHRALRRAGVPAVLQVFEGMSHIGYSVDPTMPESREAFADMMELFDKSLGK